MYLYYGEKKLLHRDNMNLQIVEIIVMKQKEYKKSIQVSL